MSNQIVYSQVPSDWTFQQTVDLFFKVHSVFDIKFEVNINPTMTFLARYLYGFKGSIYKTTLTMNNFHAKVTAAIANEQ